MPVFPDASPMQATAKQGGIVTDAPHYVLVTAAFNEERYIAGTIESVIHQTVLPQRWVIVSDGSTDRTDAIAKEYAEQYGFIRFMRREKQGGHDFSAKSLALQDGFRLLTGRDYSFYCILDADVSFDETYFQSILKKFHDNPKLGIAGGIILEYYNHKPRGRVASMSSVTGAVQCIRRECFPSDSCPVLTEIGGEDSVVEIRAKKNGWTVQSFPDLRICHHRITGSAEAANLKSKFNYGITDYRLGNPVIFEILKCCHRVLERPFFLSGLAIFLGYSFSLFSNPEKLLSGDEITFVKKMQMQKLKRGLCGLLRIRKGGSV